MGMSTRHLRIRPPAALAAALLLAGCGARPPNVLLITLDTTRADRLGCYGYPQAVTPALDRLAREGARFREAVAVAPITLPTHATLLTGLHPPEHGLHDNNLGRLPDQVPTLAESFQAAGYQTGAVVAFLVLHPRYGLDRGFASYSAPGVDERIQRLMETPPPLQADDVPAPYRRAGEVGEAALQWLRRRRGRAPWFLWVHFYDPHTPLHWNRQAVGGAFAHPYDAEVALMDQQIGRLLQHLDDTGEARRTLVVAVGDHGESLGDHGEPMHGFMLYESTLRVPLIVRYPGTIPAGLVCTSPVSQVQVPPTLLDLAGVAPAAPLAALWATLDWLPTRAAPGSRSDSLAPWLRAARGAPPDLYCYAETDYPYNTFAWAPLRAVRRARWKFIRAPRCELYDLAADPHEQRNLADSEPRMRESLARALQEREDLMQRRACADVARSAQEQRVLASVGYIGGTPAQPLGAIDPATLPDPKEVIEASVLYARLARLLEQNALGEEALRLATRLTALSPGTAGFHAQTGFLRERRGEIPEALDAFARALELNPKRADYHCHLGILRVWAGDLPGALENCRTAQALLGDGEGAHDSLLNGINSAALLAARRREFDVAGQLVTLSMSLVREHPGWRHALAGVRMMEGRREEAAAILREAADAFPHYEPVKTALRMLAP